MNLKPFYGIILITLALSQQSFAQPNKETNEKLSVISSLVVNGESIQLPEDSILRKHLKIELVSKEEFLIKKKGSISYLLADTTKFKKKKGVLRLPITSGAKTKTFTDKPVDDDGREEYEYLGQFAFLNSYLVLVLYWETLDYILVSKKNGATTSSFSAMPYISRDKKKIAVVDADPYEPDAGIEIFSIINSTIKSKLSARFKNWMAGTDEKIFWSSDGKLYLPVQWTNEYWHVDGNYNTDYLYIRISLL